jgi:hypothetical protein
MVLKPLPVMEDEDGTVLCSFQFAPAAGAPEAA